MKKVIVIPNAAIVNGLIAPNPAQPMAAAMGMAVAGAVAPASRSSKDLLSNRHQCLKHFADTVLYNSPLGVSRLREAVAPLAGMAGMMAQPVQPVEYDVLAGLGALIVDEEHIDRVSIQSAGLATVLDNVLIPMVPPLNEAVGGAAAPQFWHHQSIQTPAARAKALDGTDILVGVLDTGIDGGHPEFAGKTVHFQEFDQNGKGVAGGPRDADRHGTHVCGLIAGANAGVAPRAELAMGAVLTIRTPRGMSGYLVQIAAGLNWLLSSQFRGPQGDPGVDILNASLGASGYNNYLYQLLANARQSPGTGMVAAIGNAGEYGVNQHGSPGNYDITLGIGAIDANDTVAYFSDWGTVAQHGGLAKPDLCAPGVDIVSAAAGGGYLTMSGTSMATPIVAGAAALLLQQKPSLSFNVPGLFARILELLRPHNGANLSRGGAGILDLTNI